MACDCDVSVLVNRSFDFSFIAFSFLHKNIGILTIFVVTLTDFSQFSALFASMFLKSPNNCLVPNNGCNVFIL